MTETYISTDPGDVERWSAERDVVPVSTADGLALVHEGDAELDEERLRWDEFYEERDPEAVVVVWREQTGPESIEVLDRESILADAALDDEERREVRSRLDDGETVTVPIETGTADPADPTASGDRAERGEGTPTATGRTTPEEQDVGKLVVAANGDEVGMVTAVSEDDVAVDPHPGLTDRALGTLGWTDADDEDVTVDADRIDRITPQAIRLAGEADEERFRETTAGH